MQAELSLALMDNAIQGTSPYELAKRLQPLVKQSIVSAQAKSERLARTETARVQTQAEMDSLRRYGYKYCKWHAEIGHCSHCGALAEVDNSYGPGVYKVDEVPNIPGDTHPNCRCAISAYWVDEQKPRMQMNLQLFGKSNDKQLVKRAIKHGEFTQSDFDEFTTTLMNIFSKGVETPIEKVYISKERVYHIARHHKDIEINKNGAYEIYDVLIKANEVYVSKDRKGVKAHAYIQDKKDKPLVVYVRGGIITVYRPEDYQTKRLRQGKRLFKRGEHNED
ncbi:minor capsid protein [Ligilactobacillus ceti]|uniref:Phage head morphogenesis domain-containing protein n=1 Tax=Ligilactobacillus ceti DSM 22408 TaxID=1122146 RepID=A0A0R2KLC9_9LACO|nr:minor capsid protein [Ligilactobacillus ceti]KRN88550.1 hypothetical protein IV53_GL000515 [Ligilactobacillus ceti DSM 22408]